ncbi:hypothetical protein CPB85DRAFT_780203 [Mucidula mucida]|nr:hypothetical protein CPB85DRAFT_780203 [Mucidula mucida]
MLLISVCAFLLVPGALFLCAELATEAFVPVNKWRSYRFFGLWTVFWTCFHTRGLPRRPRILGFARVHARCSTIAYSPFNHSSPPELADDHGRTKCHTPQFLLCTPIAPCGNATHSIFLIRLAANGVEIESIMM